MCNDVVRIEANPNHNWDISIRNLEALAEIRKAALSRLEEEGFPAGFQMTEEESSEYKMVKGVIEGLPRTLQEAASKGLASAKIPYIILPPEVLNWDSECWGMTQRLRRGRECFRSPSDRMLWDYLEAELLQPFLVEDDPDDFRYYYIFVRLPKAR